MFNVLLDLQCESVNPRCCGLLTQTGVIYLSVSTCHYHSWRPQTLNTRRFLSTWKIQKIIREFWAMSEKIITKYFVFAVQIFVQNNYFGFQTNSLVHLRHGQSAVVTYLLAFIWNGRWWKSLLQLVLVAITSGKVSLWFWKSLENSVFVHTLWPCCHHPLVHVLFTVASNSLLSSVTWLNSRRPTPHHSRVQSQCSRSLLCIAWFQRSASWITWGVSCRWVVSLVGVWLPSVPAPTVCCTCTSVWRGQTMPVNVPSSASMSTTLAPSCDWLSTWQVPTAATKCSSEWSYLMSVWFVCHWLASCLLTVKVRSEHSHICTVSTVLIDT